MIVLGQAVAHDAVLEPLAGMVRLEIDAGRGRRAGRVAHHRVLDQQVFGGDHADALAVVAVADHIADQDVAVGPGGLEAAEVDAVAAALGEREADDPDVGAALDRERVAPFGAHIGRGVVIGAAHAQRRARPAQRDVGDAREGEQGVGLAGEGVFFGQHLGAGFEDDLLIAHAGQPVGDPRRAHVVDNQARHARPDRGLQGGGRLVRVKAPPRGARLFERAVHNPRDLFRVRGERARRAERQPDDERLFHMTIVYTAPRQLVQWIPGRKGHRLAAGIREDRAFLVKGERVGLPSLWKAGASSRTPHRKPDRRLGGTSVCSSSRCTGNGRTPGQADACPSRCFARTTR